jgi:hypothetical protein
MIIHEYYYSLSLNILVSVKEIRLEINTEETEDVVMAGKQNSGQINFIK